MLLFSALAVFGPEWSAVEIAVLGLFAFLQIAESKLAVFGTERGTILAILLKLLLCYQLIGWTGGVNSSFYFILLLPVLSAATSLNITGATLFTFLACAVYASFLLLIDWSKYVIPPREVKELGLRLLFLPVVGYVTHQLAQSNRVEARKYQAVAEQLALANRNLQEAEAAVRRSERLAALGQLTAGLAHELRNPLGTMKASSEMLLKNLPPENEIVREMASYISTEVDRTNSLITRFLDFARPFHLRLQPSDLGAIIDRAVAQLERHNPPFDVAVYKNYSPDIPPLPLDGELMERVFYNLLLNAAEASPAQGTITVKTRPVNEEVEVAIIDRGSGIDSKNIESIFNPFFSTKPDGVGLGLAIVAKIIDEHGGKMTVESEPGNGSVFRISLPIGERNSSL